MDLMLVLLGVTAFPVACLGFVLWMGALEDTIPADVRRAVRHPDPAPILAVPVRRTAAPAVTGTRATDWWESVATEPAGPATQPTVVAVAQRSEGAGSVAGSFSLAGGSTNL